MQTIPSTEIAADDIDDARERIDAARGLFDEAYVDGVVDLEEARRIRDAFEAAIKTADLAVQSADLANLDRAISVCAQRGGVGGQRYTRLLRQRETLYRLTSSCDEDGPLPAA